MHSNTKERCDQLRTILTLVILKHLKKAIMSAVRLASFINCEAVGTNSTNFKVNAGGGTAANPAWKAVDGRLLYADWHDGWDAQQTNASLLPDPPPEPTGALNLTSWQWDGQNGNNGELWQRSAPRSNVLARYLSDRSFPNHRRLVWQHQGRSAPGTERRRPAVVGRKPH